MDARTAPRYRSLADRLANAVLTSPGATEPLFRQAIASRATASTCSTKNTPADLPAPVSSYVQKVALHAYKIVDGDVAALKHAGYTEDAIFEITLCAALGAGRARLERGLAALKGEA
jgi:hypothetical protein